MIYNSKTKELIIERAVERKNKMTLRQLHSLYRIALSNTKEPEQFAFALYDELYKFDRKMAINFLMTGVGDDFFDGKLSRDTIASLVGKFYHPTIGAYDDSFI